MADMGLAWSRVERDLLARRLGEELEARGMRAATAESCTGGGVAAAITDIAGSSAWFVGALVTYTNEAKQQLLGVRAETLERFTAVSEATVIEMAEGGLARTGADVCVAISGVAGPGGGTAQTPVGTVWFAWAVRGQASRSHLSVFQGDRRQVREQAVKQALGGIIDCLAGDEM